MSSPPPEEISGVVKESGSGVDGAIVFAVRTSDTGNLTLEGQTTTASDGTYSISNLPPGEYHAVVQWTDSNGDLYNAYSKPGVSVDGQVAPSVATASTSTPEAGIVFDKGLNVPVSSASSSTPEPRLFKPLDAPVVTASTSSPEPTVTETSANFQVTIDNKSIGQPTAVHRWPYDEGSGTTVADAVGSLDGTVSGATWQSQSDAVGGEQLSFDGTDDRIEHSTTSNIDKGVDFTVAMTINPDSTTSGDNLMHHQTADDNRIVIGLGFSSDTLEGAIIKSSNTRAAVSLSDSTSRHRIVMTYDTDNDTLTMYNDKTGSSSGGGSGSMAGQGETGFDFGRRLNGSNHYAGTMDEPLVADETWDQSHVDADWDAQPWTA